MENKIKNKILILLLSFIAGSFLLVSCSDWNDNESVNIKQTTDPSYDKYLEKLRAYKNSDHKYVYAWFDNSNKVPYSRGQHMSDVPDSVDVVSLIYPDALADFEINDIKILQNDKGTKVVYTVSYDVIKDVYDQMVKEEKEKDENYQAPEFIPYMKEKVKGLLNLSSSYNYDGIIAGYKGQSTIYMSDAQKAAYIANQAAFLGEIDTWRKENNKMLIYEGSPQFLQDKSLLAHCKHIILNTMNVASAIDLSIAVSQAMTADIPTDRFIVKASTISLDTSDKNTGYYDTDRAIIEAAYWVTETGTGYNKAGLGIYNIQNDYYNATNVYQYAKESINIMNPAPTN